ncbi:MAG: hypothetical protein K6E29_09260 [Cyanobacteria bacterium RUI128]|nr:hypothetical protein [Cyanobacteria bacterium RUI128]
MRTEKDIKKEYKQAEYLRKIESGSRSVARCYWNAGYCEALKFVLEKRESDTLSKIKDLTDYENLKKLVTEIEGAEE